MTDFAARVAAIAGVPEESLTRLAGGDLSQVLLVRRPGGTQLVAKGGPLIATEAAMLRALAEAGIRVPAVEAEHGDILLLEHVENDGLMSPRAWADIGEVVRLLHDQVGQRYGWPVDYALGTIEMDNRQGSDWPTFWGEQRLIAAARMLDRPWRERVDALAVRLRDLLPARPAASFLHGDLWSGNILVRDGQLAALIDPACYHGDAEVDLAMLTLFDAPPEAFWGEYGALEPGWEERRGLYQLFPAIVHLRLFGATYAGMVDRLLSAAGV